MSKCSGRPCQSSPLHPKVAPRPIVGSSSSDYQGVHLAALHHFLLLPVACTGQNKPGVKSMKWALAPAKRCLLKRLSLIWLHRYPPTDIGSPISNALSQPNIAPRTHAVYQCNQYTCTPAYSATYKLLPSTNKGGMYPCRILR